MSFSTVVLDGSSLSMESLKMLLDPRREISVAVDPKSVKKVAEARRALEEYMAKGNEVYGASTQVSMRKGKGMPEDVDSFSRDLSASFSTKWSLGDHHSQAEVRVACVIILNHFARYSATTSCSPDLLQELLALCNLPLAELPSAIDDCSSLAFGDVVAPHQLAAETICKRSLAHPERPFVFHSGESLALHATNAFTYARCTKILTDIDRLVEDFCPMAIALDMEADVCNPALMSAQAQASTAQWTEKVEVMSKIRYYLEESQLYRTPPSSPHPAVSLRGAHDTLAVAVEAVRAAKRVLTQTINAHHYNPVITGPWVEDFGGDDVQVSPACNFSSTRLFAALVAAQSALDCLVHGVALRGENLMNRHGPGKAQQLWDRGFYVILPTTARAASHCCRHEVASAGRIHHGNIYDWAAPTNTVLDSLKGFAKAAKKLFTVESLIAATVLDVALDKRPCDVGLHLRPLYQTILDNSPIKLSGPRDRADLAKLMAKLEQEGFL